MNALVTAVAARRGSAALALMLVIGACGLATTATASVAISTAPGVFIVDTDDGTRDADRCSNGSDCSLGDAIEEANAHPGKDTIAFAIPGDGPHLIVIPSGPTPAAVTDAVVIDGETQPGSSSDQLVEIEIALPLRIQGAASEGTEIRGLAIHGGTTFHSGLLFVNPGSNLVERNYIGLDASGSQFRGASSGIELQNLAGKTTGNTVRGNVIVGQSDEARIHLLGASETLVEGNLIGTDRAGDAPLSNGQGRGIRLQQASSNLVRGNVVSGQFDGIWISGTTGSPSDDNRIEDNLIGTDVGGAVAIPNRSLGVRLTGLASRNVIGPGNIVSGNGSGITGHGMSIIASTGSSGNAVEGNFVGTNADGTAALGNSGTGIVAGLGTSRIADNVVSGNGEGGVHAGGGPMRIEGNHIGMNAAGDAVIANDGTGLQTFELHITSVIGGPADTQRNVVSGNAGHGIEVAGVGVQVLNNYVGSDASGTRDFGNEDDGIIVSTSSDIVVGNAADGNLVFGNGGAGVRVQGQRTIVRGNRIEANGGDGIRGACCYNESTTDGNVVGGNGGWGIDLPALGTTTHFVRNNEIAGNVDGGANIGVRALVEDNEISGNDGAGLRIHAASDSAVNRNAISGNAGDGVTVASGMRNALSANSITGNADLGIDLVDNGVTLNDATDADSGVNALQNFPVVTLARGLTVEGTLRSRPSATYRIELFWNAACDVPSDHGEGARLVGSTSVTTDAAGDASFAAALAAPLEPGVVTTTATDALGNTSEFSRCRAIVADATIVIRKATVPSGDATEFAFSGALDARLSDGETASAVVAPGEHTVTETELASWDVSAIRCDDSDSSGNVATRTATFRVAAGDTVECVFENTKRGTIVVEKAPGATGLFQFTGDAAATIPAGGRIIVANLRPGTYTSTESDPRPLYELDSIQCSDADSTGDRAARKATFDLDPGETVVCVFTNKAQACPVTASPTSLWPPNHKLIPVTLTGAGGLSLAILGVVQDEPIEGLGDGDMTPDAVGSTQPNEVLLRAERSGLHDGRVYRVEYRLQDGLGRTCTSSIPLTVVPHDQGQGEVAVDSGPPFFNSFGD